MDPYVRIGAMLFAGLAVTAAIVVALILGAGLEWWIGLILLAAADAAELAWAYVALKRLRRSNEAGSS